MVVNNNDTGNNDTGTWCAGFPRRGRSGSGSLDQGYHFCNGRANAGHDGSADDAVADVELLDGLDPGYGPDVLVGQAVPGVDRQAELARVGGSVAQGLQGPRIVAPRLGVAPGVELHRRDGQV